MTRSPLLVLLLALVLVLLQMPLPDTIGSSCSTINPSKAPSCDAGAPKLNELSHWITEPDMSIICAVWSNTRDPMDAGNTATAIEGGAREDGPTHVPVAANPRPTESTVWLH